MKKITLAVLGISAAVFSAPAFAQDALPIRVLPFANQDDVGAAATETPVFRAEALRLASESRSTLAAARALNIDPERLYGWQKAAQQPSPADPAEAAEVRALRQANKRLAQELEISKKAIASCLL